MDPDVKEFIKEYNGYSDPMKFERILFLYKNSELKFYQSYCKFLLNDILKRGDNNEIVDILSILGVKICNLQ